MDAEDVYTEGGLSWDEWFRVANAPSTYTYDCSANIHAGVDLRVIVAAFDAVRFPVVRQGYPS